MWTRWVAARGDSVTYCVIVAFLADSTACLSSQLNDSIAKTKQLAGVKVELLTVPSASTEGGQQMVWVTHNFSFLGGSLGCAEGEKITRAFEHATQHQVCTCSVP